MTPPILPRSFYERDAASVARDLIGKQLRRGSVVLRITEVEAYTSPEDTAAHSRMGPTARNAPMWGPAGHAYVYLCYGLHSMLNLVTGKGEGAAVLIRSCEPVSGLRRIRERRNGLEGPVLLTGPGKVGAALAIDTGWSHHPLYEPGGLELLDGPAPESLLVGKRIGIDYAAPRDRDAKLRFAAGGTPWVSHRTALRPARAR